MTRVLAHLNALNHAFVDELTTSLSQTFFKQLKGIHEHEAICNKIKNFEVGQHFIPGVRYLKSCPVVERFDFKANLQQLKLTPASHLTRIWLQKLV